MDCGVLTTGILDSEQETSLDEVFATLELPTQRFQADLGMGRAPEVIDLVVNGVLVTLMPTVSSPAERSPDPRESAIFLELAEQVFDRFRTVVQRGYPALCPPKRGIAGGHANTTSAPRPECPRQIRSHPARRSATAANGTPLRQRPRGGSAHQV
jgi:hypothetical protein